MTTTRPPQQMRPPPDRDPISVQQVQQQQQQQQQRPNWHGGPPSSAPTPANGPPPKEGGASSSHANISHAELSAKYTNLKKRYFTLDDRQKETQSELMRSMERNTKLRSERNILFDRIIELEDRVHQFESQLSRLDPAFLHANAIRPPSASTGAYPRALASRAAQSAFAANLQRARDELDAEGPRGMGMDRDRERERELLARRQMQAGMPPAHARAHPAADIAVSEVHRKRMMDEREWRAEEEEAAMRERENKRLRQHQHQHQQRPPFSHSNSNGDPNAGSPHPPPAGPARSGNGIGSGASDRMLPPVHSRPPAHHPSQLDSSFRNSPARLPLLLPPHRSPRHEYASANGMAGAPHSRGLPPIHSDSQSPRPGQQMLHESSPPMRHGLAPGPSGAGAGAAQRAYAGRERERYEGASHSDARGSPVSPVTDRPMHLVSQQHQQRVIQGPSQASPPLPPTFGRKAYSDSPPPPGAPMRAGDVREGEQQQQQRRSRPNINIPVLPNGSLATNNTIAIEAPSPMPIPFPSAPRPSMLQRQTKPKRLKAHTVTSKSHSIPTVPRDRATRRPLLPLNVGIMTVLSLGKICTREHFHTERYVFPVGYEVTRRYLSTQDPHAEVVYHCTILDGGDAPRFQIIAADMPDKPIVAGTATGAWSGIVRAANLIRRRQHSNSVSGPDYFGLGQNTIKHLIQELPGADKLRNYVWQTFVEGGPLGGRHAAVMPALPEDYDVGISPSSTGYSAGVHASSSARLANGYAAAPGDDVLRAIEVVDSPVYSRSSRSEGADEDELDVDEDERDELMEQETWGKPSSSSSYTTAAAAMVRTPSSDVRSRNASNSPVAERSSGAGAAMGAKAEPDSAGSMAAVPLSNSGRNAKFGLVQAKWNLRSRSRSNSVTALSGKEATRMEEEGEAGEGDAEGGEVATTSAAGRLPPAPASSASASKAAAAEPTTAPISAGDDEEEDDGPRPLARSRYAIPPESEEGVDAASAPSQSAGVTLPSAGGAAAPASERAVENSGEAEAVVEEDVEMKDVDTEATAEAGVVEDAAGEDVDVDLDQQKLRPRRRGRAAYAAGSSL